LNPLKYLMCSPAWLLNVLCAGLVSSIWFGNSTTAMSTVHYWSSSYCLYTSL